MMKPIAIVCVLCSLSASQIYRPLGQNNPLAPIQLAAIAPIPGERADWRQWDAFFTFAVKQLSGFVDETRRQQLADVFIDTRYQLVEHLRSGTDDPVPELLVESWRRLGPILADATPAISRQNASRVVAFKTTMDGLATLTRLGTQFGFFRISPTALRTAAKTLGDTGTDPLAFTETIDADLRALLGLSPVDHTPMQGFIGPRRPAESGAKVAAEYDPAQWIVVENRLDEYLIEVRDLLSQEHKVVLEQTRLAQENHVLFKHIVYATAWQESCWRQFTKKDGKIIPVSSATGDVGLMQVNRYVWRGLYDISSLANDIQYNVRSGAEILARYLTRYVIPSREHTKPGGDLARATYSAYNGGPSALARYRGVKQSPAWKKVDDAFWSKFQAINSGEELPVRACYSS